jgi:hypothetical protein
MFLQLCCVVLFIIDNNNKSKRKFNAIFYKEKIFFAELQDFLAPLAPNFEF